MYRFYEAFNLQNVRKQPYNIEVVRSSNLVHNHAEVKENGYNLACAGNTYIFMTPALSEFALTMPFFFSQMDFDLDGQMAGETEVPTLRVHVGYDKAHRTSYAIAIGFSNLSKLYVEYCRFNGYHHEVLAKCEVDFLPEAEVVHTLRLRQEKDRLQVAVDELEFSFENPAQRGFVALSRNRFPGCVVVREAEITTEETFEEETVFDVQGVRIPNINGGGIPYKLNFSISQIGGTIYNFSYALTDGISTRPIVKKRCGYSAEKDFFTNPYIRLVAKNGATYKRYLKNGSLVFFDWNVFWKYLLTFHDVQNVPFGGDCGISSDFANQDTLIIFGYERFGCSGYSSAAGGPSEFVFDTKGKLLYSGKSLEKDDVFSFMSPASQELSDLIPQDLFEREAVMEHLLINHYFTVNEETEITLKMMTKRQSEFITVKAALHSVYDEPLEEAKLIKATRGTDAFDFSVLCFKLDCGKLENGVYRAVFYVSDGDSLLSRESVTFEVVDPDSDLAPSEASGLPFLYSTPNEQAFLENDVFNPWLLTPDCNNLHYFNCSAFTPDVAMKRTTWRAIRPFKRKWYMWFSSRTVFDWTPEKYQEAIRNADYINHQFVEGIRRYDIFRIGHYGTAMMRLLNEFLDLHPEVESQLGYTRGEKFTKENLDVLYKLCGEEWMNFVCKRCLEITKADDDSLTCYNPDFLRADYGSLPIYGNPYGTYWQTKYFGRSFENQSEVYKGFMQMEDYPHSCAYQAYRGAFCLATINLFDPNLIEHPEMYQSGSSACADGIVAYAYAPFGIRVMPDYYHETQAFEYVYCTARLTEDGYRYWDRHGFMIRDSSNPKVDHFVKSWKKVLDHPPVKPVRTIAFVTDYIAADDCYEPELTDDYNWSNIHNIAEEGQAFLYGCARECGIPAGFVLKAETIKKLTAEDADVLVLPPMREADDATRAAIRKLYDAGVSLIAVSDVTGLEDLFGVEEAPCDVYHNALTIGMEMEYVYPVNTKVRYRAKEAEVIAASGDTPVMMRCGRTALINMAVSHVSMDSFMERAQFGRECISLMFKALCQDVITELSSPVVKADGCGLSAFTDESGNRMLVLFDYSAHENFLNTKETEKTVWIHEDAKDVLCEKPVTKLYDGETLKGFRIKLRPHETAMLQIV